jgi:hypothetical protein
MFGMPNTSTPRRRTARQLPPDQGGTGEDRKPGWRSMFGMPNNMPPAAAPVQQRPPAVTGPDNREEVVPRMLSFPVCAASGRKPVSLETLGR